MIAPSPITQFAALARHARPARRHHDVAPAEPQGAVTIRAARVHDRGALARLAELDGRRAPTGDALVAELDGRVVAALDVRSGRTVADPFVPTKSLLSLLGLRAGQLRRAA